MASEKDFERIFRETSPMIQSLGWRLFRHEDDVQDFVQDVYLEAFRKLDRFEGRSKLSTFLYSMALHLGLRKIRTGKRMELVPLGPEDELKSNDLDQELEEAPRASAQAVRDALASLPEAYRLPLVLYYYEKMPVARISSELGINENTIKSNLHRGRRQLRDVLGGHL